MGAGILFGAVSLIWGLMGFLLIVTPQTWISFTVKTLEDPWWRFWVSQGLLAIGLVLVIGTPSLQGFWLWVTCGSMGILKGCFLLGSTESFRARLAQVITGRSMWVYRTGGFLNLVLAVFLAVDFILHG